jgi:hypothetical protein
VERKATVEAIGRAQSGVETIDGRASVSEGIGSRYAPRPPSASTVQAVGGRKAGVRPSVERKA